MSPDTGAMLQPELNDPTLQAVKLLPDGWALATLGEALPLEYGKALPERLRDGRGAVPVYGSSGLVGRHSHKIVSGPTLVVGRKGSAGAVFYVDRDCWPIDTAYFVRPTPNVDLKYGFYFLQLMKLAHLDQSTAIPSLSRDNYSKLTMPVAPLAEQRRIVARIDELFAEIAEGEAALERARQGLDTWRRALLKAAVTGELTRDWRETNRLTETGADLLLRLRDEATRSLQKPRRRERIRGFEAPDVTGLWELPEGWTWASLAEIARTSSYGTSIKCSYEASGAVVLRIPNVRGGTVVLSDVKRATTEIEIDAGDALSPGDLLVVRTNGSEDLIGRAAVLLEPLKAKAYFASYLIRFRLVGDCELWRWIGCVFNSPAARSWIRKNIASSAGQFNISQSTLARMPVPLPPIEELRFLTTLLAAQLADGDDVDLTVGKEGTDSVALRQSILKAAFEGRLMPQDPDDEPASALLARLHETAPLQATVRRRGRRVTTPQLSLPGLAGADDPGQVAGT